MDVQVTVHLVGSTWEAKPVFAPLLIPSMRHIRITSWSLGDQHHGWVCVVDTEWESSIPWERWISVEFLKAAYNLKSTITVMGQ